MNNRQAGRRRGRGGQRQGGNPGRPDNGNRIDNRARGNAAQLLEKYKNLAQDAQRSGDRVSTEYYLQFADHYFRVLAESRSRQEDGQPRRNRDDEDEAEGVEDFGFEGDLGSPAFYQQPQQQQPQQDNDRDDRPRRDSRDRDDRDDRPRGRDDQQREARPRRDREQSSEDRPRRDSGNDERPRREAGNDDRPRRESGNEDRPRRDSGNEDRPRREASSEDRPRRERTAVSEAGDERPRREPRTFAREPVVDSREDAIVDQPVVAEAEPRRRGRPRREVAPIESTGLDMAVLPPSISPTVESAPASDDEAAPERPRRGRPRRVRTDDEAVPPAA